MHNRGILNSILKYLFIQGTILKLSYNLNKNNKIRLNQGENRDEQVSIKLTFFMLVSLF